MGQCSRRILKIRKDFQLSSELEADVTMGEPAVNTDASLLAVKMEEDRKPRNVGSRETMERARKQVPITSRKNAALPMASGQ